MRRRVLLAVTLLFALALCQPVWAAPSYEQPIATQMKVNVLSPLGWGITIYSCGRGNVPVRLDGRLLFEGEPNKASLNLGWGEHLIEWPDSTLRVEYVWWPTSAPSCPTPPAALPTPAVLLKESEAAMRGLARLDGQAEVSILVGAGSGKGTIAMPDRVEGQWDGLGMSVRTVTTPSGTSVTVNGQPSGNLPPKGAATQALDFLLRLPDMAYDWKVREDAGTYYLTGAVPTEDISALAKQAQVELPGGPQAQMFLAMDARSKVWKRMEIKLSWVLTRQQIFGREIEIGPSGSAVLNLTGSTR